MQAVNQSDAKPKTWMQATRDAIRRVTHRKGDRVFSRDDLLAELPTIVGETKSHGATPSQTLSRVMQSMRDNRELRFLEARPSAYEYTVPETLEATPLPSLMVAPRSQRITWRDATIKALHRYLETNPQKEQFTLAELAAQELGLIVRETESQSSCPVDMLERTLRRLSAEVSSPITREAPKKYHIRRT